MSKKKVVSIEDRIPKLKQARKRKANRRLVFYLSTFFFLISIIVYLQSPLSQVKTINVVGNSFVTDKDVIAKSNISKNANIWSVNAEEVEKTLVAEIPTIESAKVDKALPWTIEINVSEYERVGYLMKEGYVCPILGNGQVLTSEKRKYGNGDAPILIGFSKKEYLHKMSEALYKLPDSIRSMISEIHWKPSKTNRYKIMLYMNDGYIVDGTIRDFAEKMEVYPSIVAQLKPDSKGIIHIGVGAYFESFENEKKDASNETEG